MQFSGEELAIVAAVFFFAAFVKGITGLGFSTTCLPFLVLALGLKATLPLLIIPSLASNAIVMRDAGHLRETVRRFWPLFLAALPGVAGGLWLLDTVDARLSAAVLGVVLVGYCLFALGTPNLILPPAWQRLLLRLLGTAVQLLRHLRERLLGTWWRLRRRRHRVLPERRYAGRLHERARAPDSG